MSDEWGYVGASTDGDRLRCPHCGHIAYYVCAGCEALEDRSALLALSIDRLEISVRLANACRNLGIKTIGDLIEWSAHELLLVPNIGRVSLRELEGELANMRLRLARTPPIGERLTRLKKSEWWRAWAKYQPEMPA